MLHDDNAPPESASWHIKNVPVAIRTAAVNGARAADMSVADWISEAMRRMARVEVLPPGNPGNPPSPYDLAASTAAIAAVEIDLAGVAAAIDAVATLTKHDAAGERLRLRLAKEADRTIRAYLRRARGLPIGQTGQPTLIAPRTPLIEQ